MRNYIIHTVWLLPFLGAAVFGADDLPKPRKDSNPPPLMPEVTSPRPIEGGGGSTRIGDDELQRKLAELRASREALHKERVAVETAPSPVPSTTQSDEADRQSRRLADLMRRLSGGSSRPDATETRPSEIDRPPGTIGGRPEGSGTSADTETIDALAVAQNYYRAGNYERALEAFRKIPVQNGRSEDKAPVMYMMATCLKKLGKVDEAEKLYQSVAMMKGDEFTRFMAESAQWQLDNLGWRRKLNTELRLLRERNQSLEKDLGLRS
jgi:tetratricopeptide (TPR) repeat protein